MDRNTLWFRFLGVSIFSIKKGLLLGKVIVISLFWVLSGRLGSVGHDSDDGICLIEAYQCYEQFFKNSTHPAAAQAH